MSSAAPSVVQSLHSESESVEQISSSSEEVRPPSGKFSAYVQAAVGKVSAMSVSLPTAQPSEPVLPVSQVPVIVIADSDEDQGEEAAQDTIQHFESDVTVSVDDQFETGEKLRIGESASQCPDLSISPHPRGPSGPADLDKQDPKTAAERRGLNSFSPLSRPGSAGTAAARGAADEGAREEPRPRADDARTSPCSEASRSPEVPGVSVAEAGGLYQWQSHTGDGLSVSSFTNSATLTSGTEGTPGHPVQLSGTHDVWSDCVR